MVEMLRKLLEEQYGAMHSQSSMGDVFSLSLQSQLAEILQ